MRNSGVYPLTGRVFTRYSLPMILTDHIRTALERFTAEAGMALGALSSRALDEGKALRQFMDGERSLTLPRAERLLQYLSDHWPASADWPEELPRPAPSPASPEHTAAPASAVAPFPAGEAAAVPPPPVAPPSTGGGVRRML